MLKRQGDVIINKVKSIPEKRTEIKRENGAVVLAHGEVTGHKHQIKGNVKFFQVEISENMFARFLEVIDESVELVHEEHYPVVLEKGFYEIDIQREYTPEEIKRVTD